MKNNITPKIIPVDICICTYQRPSLLLNLLNSLSLQKSLNGLTIRIIVIDNDCNKTAFSTVERFNKKSSCEVVYDVEPQQGISYARNRALQNVDAEFVAFLDDDEVVDDIWLITMFNALNKYKADIVFGPVIGIFPESAPEWARNHHAFKRPMNITGTILTNGGSGNVLLSSKTLGDPKQLFDPSYALTGGEDSDFFYRLYLNGKTLVWCNEAVVREHIFPNRLTTDWVYRRSFRGGQCHFRILVSRYSLFKKNLWFIKKILQIVVVILIIPFIYLISYTQYVRLRCRISAAFGQLAAYFFPKHLYKEYASNNVITESENNKFNPSE